MITYKTLEVYLAKCKDALERATAAHKKAQDDIAELEKHRDHIWDQMIAVQAQKELTLELMDIENNPPTIELPFAGEAIEEMFEARLEGPDGLTPKEMHKDRQEMTYLREALEAIDDIDAINTEGVGTGEDAQINS